MVFFVLRACQHWEDIVRDQKVIRRRKIQLQLVFNTLQRFGEERDKGNKLLSVDDSEKITIKRLLGFEDCKLYRLKLADYKKGVIRLEPVEADLQQESLGLFHYDRFRERLTELLLNWIELFLNCNALYSESF